jgi:hypothetical protein
MRKGYNNTLIPDSTHSHKGKDQLHVVGEKIVSLLQEVAATAESKSGDTAERWLEYKKLAASAMRRLKKK